MSHYGMYRILYLRSINKDETRKDEKYINDSFIDLCTNVKMSGLNCISRGSCGFYSVIVTRVIKVSVQIINLYEKFM